MRRVFCLTVILTSAAVLVCDAQTRRSGSRCLSLSIVEHRQTGSLLSSAAVWKAITRAFELSGSGTMNVEVGFGVIQNNDGGFETTAVTRGESGMWRATLPASTVAIFHTHRNAVSPRPSEQDTQEADRLQRPIYVISNRGLWVYEPEPNTGSKGRNSLHAANLR
jgi:predicted transcriptional regulator YdeE